jgi:hypothetical protein
VAAQHVAIAHQTVLTAHVCALTTISCVPAEDLPAAVQRVEIAHLNASAVCVHALTPIVLAHPLQTVEHVQVAKLASTASVDAVVHQEYVHNAQQACLVVVH